VPYQPLLACSCETPSRPRSLDCTALHCTASRLCAPRAARWLSAFSCSHRHPSRVHGVHTRNHICPPPPEAHARLIAYSAQPLLHLLPPSQAPRLPTTTRLLVTSEVQCYWAPRPDVVATPRSRIRHHIGFSLLAPTPRKATRGGIVAAPARGGLLDTCAHVNPPAQVLASRCSLWTSYSSCPPCLPSTRSTRL
jgi:hypothetical protein